jgi:hypothetical protein
MVHGKSGVDQLLPGSQSFLQGGVLGIGKIQSIAFADIDGACIGVDELACPGQHPLQKDVQVEDPVQLDPQYVISVSSFCFSLSIVPASVRWI